METDTLIEAAKLLWEAVQGGQYAYAAALGLILLVTAAKQYGAKHWSFLRGDIGGPLLVLLGGFGTSLAASLGSGASFSWAILWAALKFACGAAGGYALIKKLLVKPVLIPLAEKWGGWRAKLLGVIIWVFDNGSAKIIAKAESAGDAAVEANPPSGAAGVVGKPKDVE